jgi:MFS family permease
MAESASGVVDPIEVPAWLRAAWRATPPMARLFLSLAVVDYVATAVRQLPSLLTLGDTLRNVLYLVGAPLAGAALVALPAAVLLARRDARTTAPWLLAGSVIVSLAVFASPLAAWLPGALGLIDPDSTVVQWMLVFARSAALGCGWVLVAVGLRRLERSRPAPAVAWLAALAALGLVVLPVAAALADAGTSPIADLVPGDWAPWIAILALAGPLTNAFGQATAFLVVVRAAGDDRRPRSARLAAGIAVTAAVLLSLAIEGAQALGMAFLGSPVGMILALAGGPWSTILLVVAFGLGLAGDDAGRQPDSDPASLPDGLGGLEARLRS